MVKVREDHPEHDDGSINLDAWLHRVRSKVAIEDEEGLLEVCRLSHDLEKGVEVNGHAWTHATSSFRSGLEMAEILAELHMDTNCLKAAIIYRAVREGQISLEAVGNRYGPEIAGLIDGVLRMAAISAAMNRNKSKVLGQANGQLDNLRKMLVAMVDDVRVALIKLAERTCAIRAVKEADAEKRVRVAREVFDIYAPLAHRLGIGHLKWELEDLSFRYLHSAPYKTIARQLDEKRTDREEYIQRVILMVRQGLDEARVNADIQGRAKHIYSIWRKMKRKSIDFYQVYDVRAVRILVDKVSDCYAVLGVVHSLWRHIPREFDDYIATPKDNGYRSIHTAVMGPDGKVLEIQIRTQTMHEESELGVCAHWRYKEGSSNQSLGSYDDKIAWLRQVLEWQEELGDQGVSSVLSQFASDVVDERVYVFTPDGHIVDLSQGATPLDFAYHVHTEVGHRCRGAKVNGRIVPLNYVLKTGERVEIIKGHKEAPSRDWLNANQGCLGTARARAKVQQWFKRQNREQNIIDGRAILEKEFKRLVFGKVDINELAGRLDLRAAEDVYAGLGTGDIRIGQVLDLVQVDEPHRVQQELLPTDEHRPRVSIEDKSISIAGIGNLLNTVAGCCKPLPGEAVLGYVSLARGVVIHRQDCSEFGQLQSLNPERVVEVRWEEPENRFYEVDIFVRAYDRQGLLRDISNVLAVEKVNVLAAHTTSDRMANLATMILSIEIGGLDSLGKVVGKINQLPHVLQVNRYSEGRGHQIKNDI